MLTAIDSMGEASQTPAERYFIGGSDQLCGPRPEHRQQPSDASTGRDGVAKCQASRDETDDLLVPRRIVPVDEIDRVPAPCRLCITGGEQLVQAFLDRVHFAGVLAILPS